MKVIADTNDSATKEKDKHFNLEAIKAEMPEPLHGFVPEVVDDEFLAKLKQKTDYEKTNSLDIRQGDIKLKEIFTDSRGTWAVEIKTVKDKEGNQRTYESKTWLTGAEIFPVAIVSGDTMTYVELSVKINTRTYNVVCQQSSLSSLSKQADDVKAFMATGAEPDRVLGKHLYNAVLEAGKYGLISHKRGFEITGWNDEILSNGSKVSYHVRPGDNRYLGMLSPSIKQAGDYQKWLDAFNNLFQKHATVYAALPVAFAVGGYMLGRLSDAHVSFSPMYCLSSSKSSNGKSSIQKIIVSMQTNKSGMIKGESTKCATEKVLDANSNGFACIEELHGMLTVEKDRCWRLMSMTESGGKLRGTKSGGLAVVNQWHSVIISSANMSVFDMIKGQQQEEPLQGRIIESDINIQALFAGGEPHEIAEALETCAEVMAENYGVAYPVIIDYISNNEGALILDFKAFKDEFKKNALTYIKSNLSGKTVNWGVIQRKIEAVSVAAVGMVIMSGVGMHYDNDAIDALYDIIFEACVRHSEDQEAKADNVKSSLANIFNTFFKNTKIEKYLALNPSDCRADGDVKQKMQANEHNIKVDKPLLMLEQNDLMESVMDMGNKYLWIADVAKDEIKKQTTIDLDRLVKDAKELKLLKVQDCMAARNQDTCKKFGMKGFRFILDIEA